jgi:hypothetical protein
MDVENVQDLCPHSANIEASLPQIYKDNLCEETPLFVHHVENFGSRCGEATTFYTTI